MFMKKIIPILLLLVAATANAQTFDVVPNPTSTGSFTVLGAGGAASGYAGTPVAFKNSLVLQYNATNFNEYYFAGTQTNIQFAVYKGGDSLHLISNPDAGLGVTFQGSEIVTNNKLYFVYINASNVGQLASFDGSSITLYPNPDASTNGVSGIGSLIMFRDSLYCLYVSSAGTWQFAKFTGSGLSLIPNPDNTTYGFYQDNAVIFNDRICSRYVNAAGTAVLATYDGSSWMMWPNPDNTAYGYQPLHAISYHSKLYIQYFSNAGEFRLMEWNGTNNPTLIPNLQFIAQGGYVGSPIIYNDTLFFKYLSANSTNQLAKFDGTSIALVPNPDPYDWWNGFIGSPIINNNHLYIEYETSDNKYHLAKYQSASNSLNVYHNPDGAKGYQGQCIVYDNNLFFQYLNASSTVQLGYLKNDDSLSLIANPSGVYDGIGFYSNGYGGFPYIWKNLLYTQYGSIPYGNAGNLVSFDGNGLLPVNFISFNGELNGDEALLTWSTTNEINNKGFEIEKSYDGKTFDDVGFVKSTGNSSVVNNYSFTDVKVLAGSNYYRLKQMDNDGRFNYSSTIKIDYSKFSWSILGNPSNNEWLQLQLDKTVNISVQIVSLNGRIIQTIHKGNLTAGTYSIPLNLSVRAGIYVVNLIADNKQYSKKIIK